jgi:hypothetical protein
MSKKVWAYALVLLIILSAAYYALTAAKREAQTEAPIPSKEAPAGTQQIGERTPVNPGWQVYESREMGFMVEYPADWKEMDRPGAAFFISPEQLGNWEKEIKPMGEPVYSPEEEWIYASNLRIDRSFSFEEAFGEKDAEELFGTDSEFRKIGEKQVGGVKAYEALSSGEGSYYDLIFEKDGAVYHIQKEIGEETQRPSETEQGIIDSFRFLD